MALAASSAGDFSPARASAASAAACGKPDRPPEPEDLGAATVWDVVIQGSDPDAPP